MKKKLKDNERITLIMLAWPKHTSTTSQWQHKQSDHAENQCNMQYNVKYACTQITEKLKYDLAHTNTLNALLTTT